MYEVLIAHLRECAKLDPSNNTYAEAANAIEELSKPKWIPVTERLPESGQRVLAVGLHGQAMYIGTYTGGKAMVCDFARDLVQKRPPNPVLDL